MNTQRTRIDNCFFIKGMAASLALAMTFGGMVALAQVPPPPADRTPQPFPPLSEYIYTTSPDGMTTYIQTPTGKFPSSDPFINPTNLLPTIYEDVKASDGTPIPNTLPSTPEHPYNLHPDPIITTINPTSPTNDLTEIFRAWHKEGYFVGEGSDDDQHDLGKGRGHGRGNGHDHDGQRGQYDPRNFDISKVQRALDILEGNPVPDRVYSGIPMLHYNGPNKVKKVVPNKDADGNVIGGNVMIHQVWFDSHIESDTAFIDPSEVLDVPFTITYQVDTLNKGHEDFSPMQMYFDDPKLHDGNAVPLVLMDLTFFPMEDGTRTTYILKQAPGRFWNLAYHWGWRRHPPRVQVTENARKMAMGMTLPDWERTVFGENPRASQEAKEAAIAMIGNLAPSKRMWNGLRTLQHTGFNPVVMAEIERAFFQWQERNILPDGVTPDPNADVTLFYVNNTIYGQMKDYVIHNAQAELTKWKLRGTTAKIKLINGDYYPHAYVAVDFGGLRGWENTFQNTIPVGGAGPWFTFGRAWWDMNTPIPVLVPPAEQSGQPSHRNFRKTVDLQKIEKNKHKYTWQQELDPKGNHWPKSFHRATRHSNHNADVLGEHNLEITLNYEPSRRLRIYQFDPLHHETAIWSMH
ncbi:MAG: hypothetical protein ABI618_02980 [Nitrospirota bacterium]